MSDELRALMKDCGGDICVCVARPYVEALEAERDRYKAALHCCCYVTPCGETCGAHAVEPKLPCNCDPHALEKGD